MIGCLFSVSEWQSREVAIKAQSLPGRDNGGTVSVRGFEVTTKIVCHPQLPACSCKNIVKKVDPDGRNTTKCNGMGMTQPNLVPVSVRGLCMNSLV